MKAVNESGRFALCDLFFMEIELFFHLSCLNLSVLQLVLSSRLFSKIA